MLAERGRGVVPLRVGVVCGIVALGGACGDDGAGTGGGQSTSSSTGPSGPGATSSGSMSSSTSGSTSSGAGGDATGGGGGTGAVDFATYYGGVAYDSIRDVAVDAEGNVYVVGGTAAGDPGTPGSYDPSPNGDMDVFLTKLDPTGAEIFTTYLGGALYDRAYAVEVDATGIYVGGRAGSGFPTTAGVVQATFGGDNQVNALYGPQDGFVSKLSLDGTTLLWSTYVGGPGREIVRDIAVDGSGRVSAALIETFVPMPFITPNAFDQSFGGPREGLLVKLEADASAYVYATYIGGSGSEEGAASVRADAAGNVYWVMSSDSSDAPTTAGAHQSDPAGATDYLIVKLDPSGSLVWGTFLGGSADEGGETHNLALLPDGSVVVAAASQSADFPTTPGALQTSGGAGAFVTHVASDGQSLVASTRLLPVGGYAEIQGVDIDPAGRVLVTGGTNGTMPTSADAFQATPGGGYDGFLILLSAGLDAVVYGTHWGGTADDDLRCSAIGPGPVLVGAGDVTSDDLPTTPGALQPANAGAQDAMIIQVVP